MNGVQERVYNCIRDYDIAEQSQIVEITGLWKSQVSRAVTALIDTGKIDYKPAVYEVKE